MSSPSFLGQMSLAPSKTVPVGPQQFSCREEAAVRPAATRREQTVGWSAHPEVDPAQRLLQGILLGALVVGVGLLVELRQVLHHLHRHPDEREAVGYSDVNGAGGNHTRSLLESPQIPAATSTVKMMRRKTKNWKGEEVSVLQRIHGLKMYQQKPELLSLF